MLYTHNKDIDRVVHCVCVCISVWIRTRTRVYVCVCVCVCVCMHVHTHVYVAMCESCVAIFAVYMPNNTCTQC